LKTKYNFIGDNTISEYVTVKAENRTIMRKICERVEKNRTKLLHEGMRPVHIWVPDTRREGFVEECRRQSALLNNDPHEMGIMKFLNEAADREGWTA